MASLSIATFEFWLRREEEERSSPKRYYVSEELSSEV